MEKIEYLKEISEKCLILKIRQEFINSHNGNIYEVSRRVWRLNLKRVQNVDYVFSVLTGSGEIVEIFTNLQWYKDGEKRISFKGKADMGNIGKKYIGKGIPLEYITNRSKNPCKYVNC